MSNVAELAPELTVGVVHVNDLPKMWPQLEPLVAEACRWSNGEFSIKSVVDGMFDGKYELAAFFLRGKPQSIIVLTVSQFVTGKRILEVLLASGSAMKEWMRHEREMLIYAKAKGCVSVRMIGRDGLQKMLPDWKRSAVVLEREVE